MSVNMVELGKACKYFNHANRVEYTIGDEKVEICNNCIEGIVESLKIEQGWYNPYDRK